MAVTPAVGLTCQLPVSYAAPNRGRPTCAPADRPDRPRQPRRRRPARGRGGRRPTRPTAPDADAIDLSSLSIAGITRRRVAWVAAALVAVWIVALFARQASEAASAATRADQVARDNAALAAEVASLERELDLIERPAYVAQQARGYDIGQRERDPVHARSVRPDAGSGRARVGLDAGRRRRGAGDAARVLALPALRPVRLTRPPGCVR